MKISPEAKHAMQLNALRTHLKLKDKEIWNLTDKIRTLNEKLGLKEEKKTLAKPEGILVPPLLVLKLTQEFSK